MPSDNCLFTLNEFTISTFSRDMSTAYKHNSSYAKRINLKMSIKADELPKNIDIPSQKPNCTENISINTDMLQLYNIALANFPNFELRICNF